MQINFQTVFYRAENLLLNVKNELYEQISLKKSQNERFFFGLLEKIMLRYEEVEVMELQSWIAFFLYTLYNQISSFNSTQF